MRHKGIGAVGRRAEDALAKRLGGRQTLASGAVGSDKGDIEVDGWLLEVKATETGGYRLTHGEAAKIAQEALIKGRKAGFAVLFVAPRGEPLRFGSWVMMPEHTFRELMGAAGE